MEQTIILDCRQMTGRKDTHTYIADKLSFPEYYGNNLDALYDCLTELPVCHVVLLYTECLESMGWYGEALLSVFEDAMEKNPRLTVDVDFREEQER